MLVREGQLHCPRDGTGFSLLRQVSVLSPWVPLGQHSADSHNFMIVKGRWLRKWRKVLKGKSDVLGSERSSNERLSLTRTRSGEESR